MRHMKHIDNLNYFISHYENELIKNDKKFIRKKIDQDNYLKNKSYLEKNIKRLKEELNEVLRWI